MRLHSFFLVVCTYLFVLSEARVFHIRACGGVEYSGIGCFESFPNTRWLPQSPSFVGTTFQLFTRRNRVVGRDLDADNRDTIQNSRFDGSKATKFLVHGFLQNRGMPFLANMTKALLDYEDMNVIVVGWSGGAGFPYTQAVANTRLVGAQLAKLISALIRVRGLTLDKVHIIGHSLGAHVAGYAGEIISGLGRISALDPAQPGFHGFPPQVRLDTTDANFVDVIHTDGSPYNTVGGYGMIEPVGHIDFYPNGGHSQPGCHDEDSFIGLMEDAWMHGMSSAQNHISCSHERSVHLFTASIDLHSPCTFRAFACESENKFQNGECTHCGNRPCPIMGFHADRFPNNGVFYLNTTGSEPFCGHHYFISLTLDGRMVYTEGIVQVKLIGLNGQTEWTEIKSGQMNGGNIINKMILSSANIGEVSNVNLRFIHTGSMFSWGSDSHLALDKVQVTNLRRVHPKFFCPPNMIIENGQELTLSGGSFIEATCN